MNTVNYQDWLKALFDHEVADTHWSFDLDETPVLDVSAGQAASLITRLLENIGQDTAPYSDGQIKAGLEYLFNGSISDFAVIVRDGPAPLPERVAAIRAMKHLYANFFEHRCANALSHGAVKTNPLNGVCYMLWDVSPLSYCEGSPQRTQLYDVVIEVLTFALTMKNVACIESALHGLGHMVRDYPPAKKVIREFLQRKENLGPELKEYAKAALTGYIQ